MGTLRGIGRWVVATAGVLAIAIAVLVALQILTTLVRVIQFGVTVVVLLAIAAVVYELLRGEPAAEPAELDDADRERPDDDQIQREIDEELEAISRELSVETETDTE